MSFALHPGSSQSAQLRGLRAPSHHCWQRWGYSIVPLQRTVLLGLRSVALVSLGNGDLISACLAEDPALIEEMP